MICRLVVRRCLVVDSGLGLPASGRAPDVERDSRRPSPPGEDDSPARLLNLLEHRRSHGGIRWARLQRLHTCLVDRTGRPGAIASVLAARACERQLRAWAEAAVES